MSLYVVEVYACRGCGSALGGVVAGVFGIDLLLMTVSIPSCEFAGIMPAGLFQYWDSELPNPIMFDVLGGGVGKETLRSIPGRARCAEL